MSMEDPDVSMELAEEPLRGQGGSRSGVVWQATQTSWTAMQAIIDHSAEQADQRASLASASSTHTELWDEGFGTFASSSRVLPTSRSSTPGPPSRRSRRQIAGSAPPTSTDSSSSTSPMSSSTSFFSSEPSLHTIPVTNIANSRGYPTPSELRKMRPSQRRLYESGALDRPPTSSSGSTTPNETIADNPSGEHLMRPIENLETLEKLLQNVGKAWTSGSTSATLLGTDRARTSTSGSRAIKSSSSSIHSRHSAFQRPASVAGYPCSSTSATGKRPRSNTNSSDTIGLLPLFSPSSGSTSPNVVAPKPKSLQGYVGGGLGLRDDIKSPLKLAVAKFESPRIRRRNSGRVSDGVLSAGSTDAEHAHSPGLMLPPALPSMTAAAERLRAAGTGGKVSGAHGAEQVSSGDLSHVDGINTRHPESAHDRSWDVDGIMEVDLEEDEESPINSPEDAASPPMEVSRMVMSPPPERPQIVAQIKSGTTATSSYPKRSPPPVQTPSAPAPIAASNPPTAGPKLLGMRRVLSNPPRGMGATLLANKQAGAPLLTPSPSESQPTSSSSQPYRPFKVPWGNKPSNQTTSSPLAHPAAPIKHEEKKGGVMDLDSSFETSFDSFDIDTEELNQVLSQVRS